MSKIKRILVKSLLCLSFIIGITLFASDEAYARYDCAGGGFNCTCWPGNPNRHPWSGDWDAGNECDGGQCEINCLGHFYKEGYGEVNNIPWFDGHWYCAMEEWDEWGSDGCHVWCWHHVKLYRQCDRCPQRIPTEGSDLTYNAYWHNWQHHDDWFRHPWDPCQVWDHYYDECTNCHARQGEGDTFLWWSHNNGLHWAETAVNGDRSYHALWCNAHGWVNAENCENPPPQHGQYAGTWGNLLTPTTTNSQRNDGVLKYYYHNLSPTNYGDSMHYKCTDCGHTHY